jgi:hypothetical protein
MIMARIAFIFGLLVVSACTTPETVPIPPLPIGDDTIPYIDVMDRLRTHASTAAEAFFKDNWDGVVSSARMIEQTAAFVPKAPDVPKRLKTTIAEEANRLTQDAQRLSDAAKKPDPKIVGETLSRIQFQIRTLQAGK